MVEMGHDKIYTDAMAVGGHKYMKDILKKKLNSVFISL